VLKQSKTVDGRHEHAFGPATTEGERSGPLAAAPPIIDGPALLSELLVLLDACEAAHAAFTGTGMTPAHIFSQR
jgi:hypothetical protein